MVMGNKCIQIWLEGLWDETIWEIYVHMVD